MAIDTLLFDLDGTLVDQRQFGSALQFTALVLRRFWGLTSPLATYRAGQLAVRALQTHRSDRSNFEVMVDTFCQASGADRQAAIARVERLAAEDFRAMAGRFRPVPGARAVVDLARQLGFRLVLATNPTVPFAMTRLRLDWAGLADIEWALVTRPEIMTRCKPQVAYYHELLERLGTSSDRCLMIGNDFRKDLPAMDAGIRTFLLDRPLSRKARTARKRYTPDHAGSYEALAALLRELATERDALAARPPLEAP